MTETWLLQANQPVRRVERAPDAVLAADTWPRTVPAVQQLLADGLDLTSLTVLVGENGSGKSTLVEAVALAFGMSAEGGSTGARHQTRESESSLHKDLRLVRGATASRWGFFLRAETMHGFYTYLEQNPGAHDPAFHELSHGESFLAILSSRVDEDGFYVLDEPESALSFSGVLALVGLLLAVTRGGRAQAVVATHSPLVAAIPGARLLEVGEWGWRESTWEDLTLVAQWRGFLSNPEAYLRHVTSI